jgi:hypothetical protein
LTFLARAVNPSEGNGTGGCTGCIAINFAILITSFFPACSRQWQIRFRKEYAEIRKFKKEALDVMKGRKSHLCLVSILLPQSSYFRHKPYRKQGAYFTPCHSMNITY